MEQEAAALRSNTLCRPGSSEGKKRLMCLAVVGKLLVSWPGRSQVKQNGCFYCKPTPRLEV